MCQIGLPKRDKKSIFCKRKLLSHKSLVFPELKARQFPNLNFPIHQKGEGGDGRRPERKKKGWWELGGGENVNSS